MKAFICFENEYLHTISKDVQVILPFLYNCYFVSSSLSFPEKV